MDILLIISLVVVLMVRMHAKDALEESVQMTLYEDEIEVNDHVEAILHCAIKYQDGKHEACQQIMWTHEINQSTHEEENVVPCDLYRVNTELVLNTSHLEIVNVNEKVKGWYRCTAKCGGHVYSVGCKVEELTHINSSFLCSMKSFPLTTTMLITDDTSPHVQTRQSRIMLSLIVVSAVVLAIMMTTLIRWFVRRRHLQRRQMLALAEIARSIHVTQVAASSQSPAEPSTDPQPHTSHAEAPHRPMYTNNTRHSISANPVLFQRMPDGSNYVFVPLLSLPSYETVVKESSETEVRSHRDRNLHSFLESFHIPIDCTMDQYSYSSCSSEISFQLSQSKPPSYKSVESVVADEIEEDLDDECSSLLEFSSSDPAHDRERRTHTDITPVIP